MSKLIDPIGTILGNPCQDFHEETVCSPTPKQPCRAKQVDSVTAIQSKRDNQVPGGLEDRLLKDSIGADYSFGYRHNGDSHQNWGVSDIVNWTDTPLVLDRSDNLVVFVDTHDRRKIRLSANLQNTIFDVRKKIYDILRVPLNQWRLFSCGGRLLWDSRSLAYYDFRDQRTLSMRLLIKGGGCKSRKHQR